MTTMKEEARAITKIVNILAALDDTARERVVGYVIGLGPSRITISYKPSAPEPTVEPVQP